MELMRQIIYSSLLAMLVMTSTLRAETNRTYSRRYLELAKIAFEEGLKTCPAEVEQWQKTYRPSPQWGYVSPDAPVWFARLAASLYDLTGEEAYALEAAKWLADHHEFKKLFPEPFNQNRPEYESGIPTIPDFFQVPYFCQAYLYIKDSPSLGPEQKTAIEQSIAESTDFMLYSPEWGPMNRAMLRAEGFEFAAQALPNHPNAATWRKLSRILAYDSRNGWEVEDSSVYHPVWVGTQIRYADAIEDPTIFKSPLLRYYFDYFLHLLCPAGMIPEFGDACWNENWAEYIACFERGAAEYKRPDLKWAARRILSAREAQLGNGLGVREGLALADAYRWADDTITPKAPPARSEEVLEDVIGKKIVFRNGWDEEATFLMLNYRDEGDFARVPRDFLRHTIPVEEEKMHHGHADENSICLLMNKRCVLLHDGGYRDAIPSGPFGAFRADYFHNRLVARKFKRGRHQPLFEFLRHSGSYRPVRTEKIDFIRSEEVDYSRTRVTDSNTGYVADRAIVYLKEQDTFLIMDIIKILQADYYTFATLWHGTTVLNHNAQHYVTAVGAIGEQKLPRTRALLINFLQAGIRQTGTFPIRRQKRQETAVFQTLSSHYDAGLIETFVTALVPHDRG
ncbi:MAG: hypothetical protein JSV78_00285, partial [Phycisphaerales bacterium]